MRKDLDIDQAQILVYRIGIHGRYHQSAIDGNILIHGISNILSISCNRRTGRSTDHKIMISTAVEILLSTGSIGKCGIGHSTGSVCRCRTGICSCIDISIPVLYCHSTAVECCIVSHGKQRSTQSHGTGVPIIDTQLTSVVPCDLFYYSRIDTHGDISGKILTGTAADFKIIISSAEDILFSVLFIDKLEFGRNVSIAIILFDLSRPIDHDIGRNISE